MSETFRVNSSHQKYFIGPLWRRGTSVVGSIPSWGNAIFNISISLLWVKRQETTFSSATQDAIPHEFNEKWGNKNVYLVY